MSDALEPHLAAAHERIEQLESSHWRCFHCDETFLDAASAEKHFGKSCDDVAVCQIDASKIRKMEDDLRRYRQEDTDLHRQLLSMEADHFTALRREEEKGYARGIKDYTDMETQLTRRAEAAEARVAELEAVYADKITDWEMVLETNYKMSDELARFRLLPCQCPKCGHEHMANVNPHVPKQPLPEPPKEST